MLLLPLFFVPEFPSVFDYTLFLSQKNSLVKFALFETSDPPGVLGRSLKRRQHQKCCDGAGRVVEGAE